LVFLWSERPKAVVGSFERDDFSTGDTFVAMFTTNSVGHGACGESGSDGYGVGPSLVQSLAHVRLIPSVPDALLALSCLDSYSC
jgi:hypothetical protein